MNAGRNGRPDGLRQATLRKQGRGAGTVRAPGAGKALQELRLSGADGPAMPTTSPRAASKVST